VWVPKGQELELGIAQKTLELPKAEHRREHRNDSS